jgi:hypothetical protein
MSAPTTLPGHTTVERDADPRVSGLLMAATYAVGAVALFMSFLTMSRDATAAASWAAAGAVGLVGVLSFVRHSVFHRSDAARMGWDMGRRNEFQIEVGTANLAWGITGILAWALAWGTSAAGAVTISYGIYMATAAVLHLSEVPGAAGHGRRSRVGPAVASAAYAVALVVAGAHALAA